MKIKSLIKTLIVFFLSINAIACIKRTDNNTTSIIDDESFNDNIVLVSEAPMPVNVTTIKENIDDESLKEKIIIMSNDSILDNTIIIKDNAEYYVVNGGVSIFKKEPSLDSEIVSALPFGSKVNVINKSDDFLEIDAIMDYWYQIQYENNIGWIFGGYLANISDNYEKLIGDWQTDYNYYRFYKDGTFRGGIKYSGYMEAGKWFLSDTNLLYFYGYGGWGDEMDYINYNTIAKRIIFSNDNSYDFSGKIYSRETLSYEETGLSPNE